MNKIFGIGDIHKTKEIWKDIEGYEKKYQISNFGNIRSLNRKVIDSYQRIQIKKGKVLKPLIDKDGYYSIRLYKNTRLGVIPRWYKIHRLVALAFIKKPNIKLQINHKDGNKQNNNDWNLEWCTEQENKNHAYKNGFYNNIIGEKHYRAKLTKKQVMEIRKKYQPYKYSCNKLANEYKVGQSTIESIISNRS